MNRTFPAMVLKIERDSVMPGTSIPTGKNKKVTWEYPRSLSEVCDTVNTYKNQPCVVRITLCTYGMSRRWIKTRIWTHGERTWQTCLSYWANKEERIARTAIIPAEVIREATRAAQS